MLPDPGEISASTLRFSYFNLGPAEAGLRNVGGLSLALQPSLCSPSGIYFHCLPRSLPPGERFTSSPTGAWVIQWREQGSWATVFLVSVSLALLPSAHVIVDNSFSEP